MPLKHWIANGLKNYKLWGLNIQECWMLLSLQSHYGLPHLQVGRNIQAPRDSQIHDGQKNDLKIETYLQVEKCLAANRNKVPSIWHAFRKPANQQHSENVWYSYLFRSVGRHVYKAELGRERKEHTPSVGMAGRVQEVVFFLPPNPLPLSPSPQDGSISNLKNTYIAISATGQSQNNSKAGRKGNGAAIKNHFITTIKPEREELLTALKGKDFDQWVEKGGEKNLPLLLQMCTVDHSDICGIGHSWSNAMLSV